jgi:hypothetical protein
MDLLISVFCWNGEHSLFYTPKSSRRFPWSILHVLWQVDDDDTRPEE